VCKEKKFFHPWILEDGNVNRAMTSNENQEDNLRPCWTPKGGTLGISGWGCAAGTLGPWNP